MRAVPTTTMLRACAAIVLGLFLAAGSGLPTSPAKADPSVSVDFFYDSLEPDGRWVDHWKYGRVWYPNDRDDGWRPYTRGRWVLTDDYGWYWESSERFGWATYHYGRWDFDDDYGWIWVPGDQWGPAWVDWREGGGNIGWAPLPPTVVWRERGFDYGGIDIGSERYRSSWCFVPEARFVSGDIHRHVLPQARNITIINNTTKITNYTTVNNTIVNNSVSVARINKVARTNIAPVKVVQAAAPVAGAPRTLLPSFNRPAAQVSVFRPEVKPGARAVAPASTNPVANAGPAGKAAATGQPPATLPQPATAPAQREVPVLPKGGLAKSAPVAPQTAPQTAVTKAAPVQPATARPPGPDPRAQQAGAAEQTRLRDLQARQAREASRQNREQVIERYTTVTKPRDEIARKQAAERQELQRIQQNQRTVVQNRAAIPQQARPQPPPQVKAAAQQPPHKAPPPAQKPGQPPPPDPKQPR